MRKLRTIATVGVMSIAGLGLIGAGAHAIFTTTTASSQSINVGTATVVTWSADATNGCTTEAIAASNPATCQTVTLPVQKVGSTFDTTPSTVWVQNVGTLTVYEDSLGVSDNPDNGTLQTELGLCIYSDSTVVYNGALTGFPDFNAVGGYQYPVATATANALTVGQTDSYSADFYAGEISSQCGGAANDSLTNPAEGGSDTVTITPDYGDTPT
jgi:hypothetical protein